MSGGPFLDTGVLFARLDPRDDRHAIACLLYPGGPAWTTNFVIDEVLTLALSRRGAVSALRVAEALWAPSPLHVERVTAQDELAARRYFVGLAGAGASFTDCTSFAVVERLRLPAVLSFDRHFRLPGTFAVLP